MFLWTIQMYVTQHVANQMFIIREASALTSWDRGVVGSNSARGIWFFPAFVLYIFRRHVRVDLSDDAQFPYCMCIRCRNRLLSQTSLSDTLAV